MVRQVLPRVKPHTRRNFGWITEFSNFLEICDDPHDCRRELPIAVPSGLRAGRVGKWTYVPSDSQYVEPNGARFMADVFYQCAITCDSEREAAREKLAELLERAGYEESPEVYDPSGEYVLARVYGDIEVGSCIQIYDQPASYLTFAQSLAVQFGSSVVFHEVTISGEPGTDDWARVMVLEIDPDGSQRDVPPQLDMEPTALDGLDKYKASRRLLRGLVNPEIDQHPNKPVELWMYREVEELPEMLEDEKVDERLQAIIDDVAKATKVSMTEIYGRRALQMDLPDGTQRMSVVSDEDLQAITEATGISL